MFHECIPRIRKMVRIDNLADVIDADIIKVVGHIPYTDVTDLKDMIWQKYDSGEITENVYKQVMGRLQKYREDVDPVEDFQDWLTG